MTHAQFTQTLGTFDKHQKTNFYIDLARNLTVAVRGIWSDEHLSVDDRFKQLKAMNEAMHRVLNRLRDVQDDQQLWTDDQLWHMLLDTITHYPAINEDVGGMLQIQ
jgi:hypothetical protein